MNIKLRWRKTSKCVKSFANNIKSTVSKIVRTCWCWIRSEKRWVELLSIAVGTAIILIAQDKIYSSSNVPQLDISIQCKDFGQSNIREVEKQVKLYGKREVQYSTKLVRPDSFRGYANSGYGDVQLYMPIDYLSCFDYEVVIRWPHKIKNALVEADDSGNIELDAIYSEDIESWLISYRDDIIDDAEGIAIEIPNVVQETSTGYKFDFNLTINNARIQREDLFEQRLIVITPKQAIFETHKPDESNPFVFQKIHEGARYTFSSVKSVSNWGNTVDYLISGSIPDNSIRDSYERITIWISTLLGLGIGLVAEGFFSLFRK